MTGLCATYGHSAAPTDATRLAEAMEYRALGGYDCISFSDCTLCHLHYGSLVKPQVGSQPVVEDRAAITLDGSIDNRNEVHSILNQYSTSICTNFSDAEFLLNAYTELGMDVFNHIHGSFVGVIYDRTTRETILFRGISGGRHLYYANIEGEDVTLIASEIGALLQHQAVNREVREKYVSDYISGSVGRESITFHSSVERLRQGEYIVLSDEEISRHRVVINDSPRANSSRYSASQLRTRITQAVDDRIGNSNSSGVMLSGGLDSSTIAAEMARQMKYQSVNGYTLLFPEEKSIDELSNIRSLTQSSTIESTEIRKSVRQLFDEHNPFEHTFAHPCIDTSLPIFEAIFDRAAADNVNILHTGIGGNLHDGNRLFYSDLATLGEYREFVRFANNDQVSGLTIILYTLLPRIFSTAKALTEIDKLNSSPPSFPQNNPPEYINHFDRLETLQTYLNLTNSYMDYALDACRQVALSHNIELQHPFLDSRILIDLLQTNPGSRLKKGSWKAIFRDAVRNILPQEIVETPVSENSYISISEQLSMLYFQSAEAQLQEYHTASDQEEVWRKICAAEWASDLGEGCYG